MKKFLSIIIIAISSQSVDAQINCNTWLETPSNPSYVDIGKLNITGDKVTVEAVINRTEPYLYGVGDGSEGDVVSKHDNPTDVNYLLRPNHGYITTTNGFFGTPDIADIELNKTYHIAMVYDGATLKFYRNGCLMSQVAATGNLFQNSWDTRIGYLNSQNWNTNFIGYINEVRIWNVARTQEQIQTYMNTSLPNPATQPGLLAYYEFDNLTNKQGNTAYNGTLGGSASINEINPQCGSIANTCVVSTQSCDTWLHTPSAPSSVRIGQLNIPGNQITLEAEINRTAPYSGGQVWAGDIIAKHRDPTDANYILRPNSGEITTTNGYFKTPDIADIQLNRTYHVAMVYDGATLKFYRDGCLMSQIAATGNLIQNGWEASIGYYSPQLFPAENFIGYINEARIWNIARTQQEIRDYMNSSLPNPTTQSGLLAYYTFDNLTNKQGNPSWNGTLNGSAAINQTNPSCNAILDLCAAPPPPDTQIINDYTEVRDLDPCNNVLTVTDASKYKAGDTVMIIQMEGSVIDSSNTAAFGNLTNYNNAGNYEFNIIKQKTGNTITLLNALLRNYDIPLGKVQLIRVPYYSSLDIQSTLTCLPWDGSKGGVLAFNVTGQVTMHADIDVSGRGFFGGKAVTTPAVACSFTDYATDGTDESYAAAKGEGIFSTHTLLNARGKLANGGGGGNSSNAGGAGGGNGGMGGNGGNQYPYACGPAVNGGVGGSKLSYTNVLNKIFMGGGGGAGQANDNPLIASGGNGGGVVILHCGDLTANGFAIRADGGSPLHVIGSNDDGRSGGGAGGTVLLNYTASNDPIEIFVQGGTGDYCSPPVTLAQLGPGGGGGGGVIWTNKAAADPNITTILNGGINGTNTTFANDPYGATAGKPGLLITGLSIPVASVPFKPNIDSVRFTQNIHNCSTTDFSGLGYTQTSPITQWSWDFGDGNKGASQNLSYTYPTFGTFPVKLVGKDINGCKDSVVMPVTLKDIDVSVRPDTSFCGSRSVKLFAAGGTTYAWTPATGLDDPLISDPVATPLASTKYEVTVSDARGCSKIDSVHITVNDLPVISKSKDTSICTHSSASLFALSVGSGVSYQWSPAATLSDPGAFNPVATPNASTIYTVKVTTAAGCSDVASIGVDIDPVPVIAKSKDSTICNNTTASLFASGGSSYAWSPASSLNDPASPSPVASPQSTTLYHVAITDAYSCVYHDSVKITVKDPAVFSVSPDDAVCAGQSRQLSASGGDIYQWSPASFLDNPQISNPVALPGASITYSVTITENTCHESQTLSTKLTLLPSPDVRADKSNDITCSLSSAHLSASGAQEFTWTPADGLSNPGIYNPLASPVVSTLYTVSGKDQNGCTGSDTVSVKVDFNGNALYGLPNSFTPNGDGLNDCFGVRFWGQVEQLDFSIYNRFGERVFHTNNAADCWNGTYKGSAQNAGVFVYTIKAKTICANIDKKGTVVLIR